MPREVQYQEGAIPRNFISEGLEYDANSLWNRRIALVVDILTSVSTKTENTKTDMYNLVRSEGIEPPTVGLKGHCSAN